MASSRAVSGVIILKLVKASSESALAVLTVQAMTMAYRSFFIVGDLSWFVDRLTTGR